MAPQDVVEALEVVRQQRPRIGQLALSRSLLSVAEVCDVLDRQVEAKLPFGAIAVDLGYLTEEQLASLLEQQHQSGPASMDVLRRRGLISEQRLSQLHDAYLAELESEYAGAAEDTTTELMAAPGLCLALSHVQCIEPFSEAAQRALRRLSLAPPDVDGALGELASDLQLARRVLELATSEWCGAGASQDSLADVAKKVGPRQLSELLLAATFLGLFDLEPPGSDRVQSHSLGVAAVARQLATWAGAVSPTFLMLAGLVHDIGKLLFISQRQDTRVLGADETEFPTSAHLIERMRLGYDHAVLGEMALRLWGFPSELAALVGMHHYEKPPARLERQQRMALGLVALSDLIEHALAARDVMNPALLETVMQRYGLSGTLEPEQLRARWSELARAREQGVSLER